MKIQIFWAFATFSPLVDENRPKALLYSPILRFSADRSHTQHPVQQPTQLVVTNTFALEVIAQHIFLEIIQTTAHIFDSRLLARQTVFLSLHCPLHILTMLTMGVGGLVDGHLRAR